MSFCHHSGSTLFLWLTYPCEFLSSLRVHPLPLANLSMSAFAITRHRSSICPSSVIFTGMMYWRFSMVSCISAISFRSFMVGEKWYILNPLFSNHLTRFWPCHFFLWPWQNESLLLKWRNHMNLNYTYNDTQMIKLQIKFNFTPGYYVQPRYWLQKNENCIFLGGGC